MFTVTREWLFANYGSLESDQVDQTKKWLEKYGKNVPPEKLNEWSQWKHLSEYQVNTETIVDDCLAMIGKQFPSELQVHREVNLLRVPIAKHYETGLRIANPSTILELGVGGDSAISTAIFLSWLERRTEAVRMISVDRNPLSVTFKRYNKFPFWNFIQSDSVQLLDQYIQQGLKFGMIFIDTIHSYTHTLKELELSSKMTNFMLMDDAGFPGNDFDPEPGGVKRAIEEWMLKNSNEWVCDHYHSQVALISRK